MTTGEFHEHGPPPPKRVRLLPDHHLEFRGKYMSNTFNTKDFGSMLPDPPKDFRAEAHLSNVLLNLTNEDRKEIEEEIHGVGCRAVVETAELIERSLEEFDLQLNQRKEADPSKNVLRNVIRVPPILDGVPKPNESGCYLNDPAVRLRFIRCERFVIYMAVQRFVDFLEFMSELFGDFVGERPVDRTDFCGKELYALMNSRNQYLPYRDRSGRRVLAGVGNCNFHLDVKLRYKILMYLHWAASQDLETQLKGVVVLAFPFNEENEKSWEEMRPGIQTIVSYYHKRHNDCIPIRIASWQHYYKDTPYFRTMANLYLYSVDSRYRSLYKVHFGDQNKMLQIIGSYGVPADLMPLRYSGQLKFANHRAWLNAVQAIVTIKKHNGEEVVECPRSNDVVFRKGATHRVHFGNLFYRNLIQKYAAEHFVAKHKAKYDITLQIIDTIKRRNGRFLSREGDFYVVCTDIEKIRKKIAAAMKQHNRQN